MNNKELQALRILFFLSVPEAAKHIGNVSERSWRNWESGKYNIPEDVSDKMQEISEKRMIMIETTEDLMQEKQADEVVFEYHKSLDEYQAVHSNTNTLDWRLSQSVAAYFFAEGLASLN